MKIFKRDEEGVSPVIAVILMVAITVVLAAVLYVMVSGMMQETETTPRGSLRAVPDETIANQYNLQFEGNVALDKITITLRDTSVGKSAIMDPPSDGANASVSGGAWLIYDDVGTTGKLDGTDTLTVGGGAAGDIVTVTYKKTGGTVGTVTL
ncbi:MAG: type IV pilin N-terminal domain-containing protein [Thermoplasmata archaeon]|nr:MAG: type IV pilin N-terminal domain-containing protein [Thermoplasmata archaeon]